MPSSFRDLMVALIRLSCGSFWKPSAHSTIRAFSFSHTFGWAYRGHANKQLCSFLLCLSPVQEEDANGWPITVNNFMMVKTLAKIPSVTFWPNFLRVFREYMCETDTGQVCTKTPQKTDGVVKWKKSTKKYTPCSAHCVLHWQTLLSRFPSEIFCHSLTHRHPATAREVVKIVKNEMKYHLYTVLK